MGELAKKTAQLGRSCRHYNALAFFLGEGGCNIGHPIKNIVAKAAGSSIGIAFKLPCRPGPERAAQCPDYDPKTDAERKADKNAMRAHMDQVMKMLDRALESNGDMMVRIGKLEAQAGSIVPVIRALEAWYDVVRNGRTIEPSLMGLADMIGILHAAAGHALNRAALARGKRE